MGYGDEIMATGFARIIKLKNPESQIVIGDEKRKLGTFSEVFIGNPYISNPQKLSKQKKIISIAGGGDTVAAIKKNKKFNNFTFLSTGGGAFLKWLENFELPLIEPLKKNKIK